MDEPRRIPIHRSLNRPNLILGGERELVLMTLLFAVMIGFTASSWLQIVIAIVFWIVVHSLLIQMAKADPMMSRIYIRHVKYRPYYPARSGLDAIVPRIGEWKD